MIAVLARPTLGDENFYSRWEGLGMSVTANPNPDAQIAVIDHDVIVSHGFFSQLPGVRVIVTPNTAHTHIAWTPVGTKILSLKGKQDFLKNVRSVSELTFQLILKMLRDPSDCHTLNGKTIGIIGCGRIGQHVLEVANAFQMKCRVIDKYSTKEEWERTFRFSNIISIHLNECLENNGIVSKEYLSLLRPDSYLVNTARGSVLDEKHLAHMLETGKIKKAAVDVIQDHEALNEKVPNLFISPHVGGRTFEDRIKTDEFMVKQLKDWIQSEGSSPKLYPW